jgi:hypothetical protein
VFLHEIFFCIYGLTYCFPSSNICLWDSKHQKDALLFGLNVTFDDELCNNKMKYNLRNSTAFHPFSKTQSFKSTQS